MIQFNNVTKVYKMGDTEYHALRGVNLSIGENELVALVGPSGSGKSTTMHIMGLLDSPTAGQYTLDGQVASQFNRNQQALYRNQKIGFIFQQFFLLPKLTALENVSLPLLYRNIPRNIRKQKAMAMLEAVDMASHACHRPSELSGGQQQRVAIARALVGEPEIILADEPTGALDTKTSAVVMDLLKSFVNRSTIVVITHDLDIAAQCPRRLHILDGLIDRDETCN